MAIDYQNNPKVILLEEQPDGNWIAEGIRFGKKIRVRGGMPESVLKGFLTDDGKEDSKTV